MKQLLRSRGGLCPKPKPIIHLLYKLFLTFTVVLVSCVCSRAQVAASSPEAGPVAGAVEGIKPLKVGDTIPEALWNLPLQVANHPEGKQNIHLGDYRGKLIILDFWATWCSSCIGAMPRVDSVAQKYRDELKVLPVSYESREKACSFLKTNRKVKALNLFSVIADSILSQSFPHRTVPHYAWISPEGQIVATMASADITEANVDLVLAGKVPVFDLKKKIDTSLPLFLKVGELPKHAKIKGYALVVEGRVPDLPGGGKVRERNGTVYGQMLSNKTLGAMYLSIARKIMPGLTAKRFDYRLPEMDNIGVSADMRTVRPGAPLHTFDIIVPPGKTDSLFYHALDFLNKNTGYRCEIMKQKRPCLVLRQRDRAYQSEAPEETYAWDENGYSVSGYPMADFVHWLNRPMISGELVVLNETGYGGDINIQLLPPFDDFEHLKKELGDAGLFLMEAEREIDMFVISKTKDKF